MAYAISLYDALVSINVPKPQALAVVESLEQTMTSELATKTDLDQLRAHTDREFVAVRQEIQQLRGDMERKFASLRGDMEREFASLRGDMEREFIAVRREMAAESALLREEIKSAISRSVIMLTGMMIALNSLLFAALQFFG